MNRAFARPIATARKASIRKEGATAWGAFSDRLEKLVSSTRGIGWGYHDHLADVVGYLADHFNGC